MTKCIGLGMFNHVIYVVIPSVYIVMQCAVGHCVREIKQRGVFVIPSNNPPQGCPSGRVVSENQATDSVSCSRTRS